MTQSLVAGLLLEAENSLRSQQPLPESDGACEAEKQTELRGGLRKGMDE